MVCAITWSGQQADHVAIFGHPDLVDVLIGEVAQSATQGGLRGNRRQGSRSHQLGVAGCFGGTVEKPTEERGPHPAEEVAGQQLKQAPAD